MPVAARTASSRTWSSSSDDWFSRTRRHDDDRRLRPRGEPRARPSGLGPLGARACVDITALNPPPSPGEIFRYFQTLPLPQLTTQHQPPGNGLVGLPVIFFTDSATTQTFT